MRNLTQTAKQHAAALELEERVAEMLAYHRDVLGDITRIQNSVKSLVAERGEELSIRLDHKEKPHIDKVQNADEINKVCDDLKKSIDKGIDKLYKRLKDKEWKNTMNEYWVKLKSFDI